MLHKYRFSVITVGLFVAFVVFVPPFSHSIQGALNGTDGSAVAHGAAVGNGVQVVITNPLGTGVGQGDQLGAVYATAAGTEAAGVGENMYLTTYACVGPLGLLAFAAWIAGLFFELMFRLRKSLPIWIPIGVAAALMAEAAAGLTASTLMRFTTAASLCLLVGLIISVPGTSWNWPRLGVIPTMRRALGRPREADQSA